MKANCQPFKKVENKIKPKPVNKWNDNTVTGQFEAGQFGAKYDSVLYKVLLEGYSVSNIFF